MRQPFVGYSRTRGQEQASPLAYVWLASLTHADSPYLAIAAVAEAVATAVEDRAV